MAQTAMAPVLTAGLLGIPPIQPATAATQPPVTGLQATPQILLTPKGPEIAHVLLTEDGPRLGADLAWSRPAT